MVEEETLIMKNFLGLEWDDGSPKSAHLFVDINLSSYNKELSLIKNA